MSEREADEVREVCKASSASAPSMSHALCPVLYARGLQLLVCEALSYECMRPSNKKQLISAYAYALCSRLLLAYSYVSIRICIRQHTLTDVCSVYAYALCSRLLLASLFLPSLSLSLSRSLSLTHIFI